jgi:hypothetical protein
MTPKADIPLRLLDVRFGSKADIGKRRDDVRSTPKSGHREACWDVRFVPIADSCTAAKKGPIRAL